MDIREPFLLKPIGKDYLWGGSRLNTEFSKNIPLSPLAESWECSTHKDGSSIIASGDNEGMSLTDYIKQHPEVMGDNVLNNPDLNHEELPILIKLIDAKSNLSVQVHPNDEYAKEHENGSLGKTEVWYVLDATTDASLVYGFSNNVTEDMVRESAANGTLEKYLQKVQVKKDDLFFIPSGTVHAIGAGALIVEIQEDSNITYRLYDYDRKDKNGNKRELHVEKAIEVMNMNASSLPKQRLRYTKFKSGYSSEFLCMCKYFKLDKLHFNSDLRKNFVEFKSSQRSFQTLLCTEGCGVLYYGTNFEKYIPFFRGDCIFIPSNSYSFKIHGVATFLKAIC